MVNNLVDGWPTPLKKYDSQLFTQVVVSWDDDIPMSYGKKVPIQPVYVVDFKPLTHHLANPMAYLKKLPTLGPLLGWLAPPTYPEMTRVVGVAFRFCAWCEFIVLSKWVKFMCTWRDMTFLQHVYNYTQNNFQKRVLE